MSELDYAGLGLRVGLEIHQQLSVRKLFCACLPDLSDDVIGEFERTLRPSQSEMGEIDRAAIEEAQRRLRFTYETTPYDCLVESDEEPPHAASEDAVITTLIFSKMVGAKPVDEIQFMRKIVIDGSNTAGFQRTALIAMNGGMETAGKSIGIDTICLEEDAARRISEEGRRVTFRLDRLGIPLIEIATSPDIETPEQTREVAQRIGTLLRATRRVRRGIGSIREDLNISISGGARVEIKGVQDLDLLPICVEKEVRRQLALLAVTEELKKRGTDDMSYEVVDVTELMRDTSCKILAKSQARGDTILAVRLPGFSGLMRANDDNITRLGREFAAHAKVAGVGGIFHSDELPGYGITDDEVRRLQEALHAGSGDGFAMVAGQPGEVSAAVERIIARARQALIGIPEETRDPLPDGTTAYSRPLPGKARMYPETDVPPIPKDEQLDAAIDGMIPLLPEQTVERLQKDHSLSKEQAETLVSAGFDVDFDNMTRAGVSSRLAARTLINTLPELQSDGLDLSRLDQDTIIGILQRVERGEFAKEAISQVVARVVQFDEPVDEALVRLNLSMIDDSLLEKTVDRVLQERRDFVLERGERSLGPLMGVVMKELRGSVDGKILSDLLSSKITEIIRDRE